MSGTAFQKAALLLALAAPAAAQSAYEIQVYGSGTVERGQTFAEIHSNTAPKGPTSGAGDVQPDHGAFHETLELTHGFTDWFETGFYLFSSARSGEGWQWVGDHVRPRVRVPESWGWPVGASLSVEAGYLRPRFSESRWDAELRPIVDWKRGPFYVSVNPALERVLTPYAGAPTRFVFAPALKLSWDVAKTAALGLEYYGSVGPVDDWSPAREQEHQVFFAYDLAGSERWEVNAAVGAGLTAATDRLVLKVIIGRRL